MIKTYKTLSYAIQIKHTSEGEWIYLTGWYISPKKAVASYKRMPYKSDVNWNQYFDIRIIVNESVHIEKEYDIELNKIGINFANGTK
jgi:hypothetical protein